MSGLDFTLRVRVSEAALRAEYEAMEFEGRAPLWDEFVRQAAVDYPGQARDYLEGWWITEGVTVEAGGMSYSVHADPPALGRAGRLRAALDRIVGLDYRGNPTVEQGIALEAIADDEGRQGDA